MQQVAGVIALIAFLFLCFCRWVMLGLSLLRKPIIARVLRTPSALERWTEQSGS
jgi:hypothetical protein